MKNGTGTNPGDDYPNPQPHGDNDYYSDSVPQRDVMGFQGNSFRGKDSRYEYRASSNCSSSNSSPRHQSKHYTGLSSLSPSSSSSNLKSTTTAAPTSPRSKRNKKKSNKKNKKPNNPDKRKNRFEISTYMGTGGQTSYLKAVLSNECVRGSYLESLLSTEDRSHPDKDMVLLWCMRNGLKHVEVSALDGTWRKTTSIKIVFAPRRRHWDLYVCVTISVSWFGRRWKHFFIRWTSCGGTVSRLAAPHSSRLTFFSPRSHCFFLPNQGSGMEQMMEEAVKLAMESSASRDGNNNNSNNLSSSNSSSHGDTHHHENSLSHYPQKSVQQEQPSEQQQQHVPQEEIKTPQQQEEVQKQKGYYHYYRRNQELDLTQRYAPKDNCWMWTCLTRGPFQFCKFWASCGKGGSICISFPRPCSLPSGNIVARFMKGVSSVSSILNRLKKILKTCRRRLSL